MSIAKETLDNAARFEESAAREKTRPRKNSSNQLWKEGAFASWLAWTRAAGALLRFGVGSASPAHVGGAFGGAFLGSFLELVVLLFGNVSNGGDLVAAGHVKGVKEKKRQSVHGSNKGGEGSIEDRETYGRPMV